MSIHGEESPLTRDAGASSAAYEAWHNPGLLMRWFGLRSLIVAEKPLAEVPA